MLQATIVTTHAELGQIHRLNHDNLKQNVPLAERKQQGFVTWLYPVPLLEQMHALAPSVIVKDSDAVIGYALVTLKEAVAFHADLKTMMHNLQPLFYGGRPLFSCNFYCMGQICIHKAYRGRGVFSMLYQKHREIYRTSYQLLVTEISSSNQRSMKAHENVGFKILHTYADKSDEWAVVVWDWK